MSENTTRDMVIELKTQMENVEPRITALEKINQERNGRVIKVGWGVLKAIGLVTFLTILSDMAKDGCKICKGLYNAIIGQN